MGSSGQSAGYLLQELPGYSDTPSKQLTRQQQGRGPSKASLAPGCPRISLGAAGICCFYLAQSISERNTLNDHIRRHNLRLAVTCSNLIIIVIS